MPQSLHSAVLSACQLSALCMLSGPTWAMELETGRGDEAETTPCSVDGVWGIEHSSSSADTTLLWPCSAW